MKYITTVDNPWNPFTNWNEWLAYDMVKGYFTCNRVSRLAPISEVLPDSINRETLKEAYDQMIKEGAFDKDGNFVEYTLVSNEKTE